MSKPTTVISVRRRKPAELLADPDFVYVGRWMPRQGWEGSIWGNPFKAGMDAEDAIDIVDAILTEDDRSKGESIWSEQDLDPPFDPVAWYRMYVLTRLSLFSRLPMLKGKTLGCWCGTWKPGDPPIACHAVVLAQLADGLEVTP